MCLQEFSNTDHSVLQVRYQFFSELRMRRNNVHFLSGTATYSANLKMKNAATTSAYRRTGINHCVFGF